MRHRSALYDGVRGLIALFGLLSAAPIAAAGGGIPLRPGGAGFTTAQKVPVADCRVLRAFVGTPIDGTVHSRHYAGRTLEYPTAAAGAGILYSYNKNDGLHITLDDGNGFDAVVLRGGARTSMYAGATEVAGPGAGKALVKFKGGDAVSVATFPGRVRAKRLSFFGTRDGSLAEVGFYRVSRGAFPSRGAELWSAGEAEVSLPEPDTKFAPESLRRAMRERYGEEEGLLRELVPGSGKPGPLRVPAGRALHLITRPFEQERGLAAIALEVGVSAAEGPFTFTVVVQDPLDPRLDLVYLPFALDRAGPVRLGLDIPDQVLLQGNRLWLTLLFDRDVVLTGPKGGVVAVRLQWTPRGVALPEAIARRKMLLRTFFGAMSEPRPWGLYKKQSREEFFASSRYASQCPELFMTIDQCHALDPTDDLVRQVREWVYLRNLEELSEVAPPPAPPPGVPDWAWYPRMAWLEFRRQVQWWLENRVVPTGEFGGQVGDDSDFYQQLADLPFFETGGLAAELKDGAARMAELADKERLRGGINIHTTDSLHAYEEGINHLALMARWFYGDPIYLERCMDSARNMEKLTIVTADGRRHFRDRKKMGAGDIERPRAPAMDAHANPLMWHTALQLADYNRNPRALGILREWADTWLKFLKPGRWASGVEVLTGKVVAFEKDRPLYGGYRAQATVFTWLSALAGDRRYLEPFLHYYRQGRAPYPANTFLADTYALGALEDLDKARLRKLAAGNPAAALAILGDPNPLVQATIGGQRNWRATVDNLYDARRWPDMYTIMEPYTDRVFMGQLIARASMCYLGGFCKRNKFNPTHAVSWEGFGTDYAALVLENRRASLRVAACGFAQRPLKGGMRVWALEHGRYELTIGRDTDGDFKMDAVTSTATRELARADVVELTLAPKTVTLVELKQVEKLDPIFGRADLAIAAREVKVEGGTLAGTVHNLGSADVPDAVVAVMDAGGKEKVRASLGRLAAPLDLVPERTRFELRLPGAPQRGWRLVLDPADRVPEIYEGNNEVALDALPAPDYAESWDAR